MGHMDNRPCKDGDIFTLKDGFRVEIVMTHKPGNGYGVHYRIIGKEYGPWPEDKEAYTPWYKFRKMIRKDGAV